MHDYMAETDVSMLKYDCSTFQQILDQFPDFYDDLKTIISDKKELIQNSKYIKSAVQSETLRGIIVEHYNDIISDEQAQLKQNNQSLALKI